MNLPESPDLPFSLLAACFNKTSATYKFYWFLAIINRVELGERTIAKQSLFAEMLGHAWYTVNYFKVSFGKQDQLQQAIRQVIDLENLTIDADRHAIYQQLSSTTHKGTLKQLSYFNSEVPHRFLSPWFPGANMQEVYEVSKDPSQQSLYALHKDHIEINPAWIDYLQRHARILRNFCYWNLAIYLQSKNPNVPDIPNKLIKLPIRKALTEQRKFWDIVIGEFGSVDCIYTNRKLTVGDYAVEHFLPYAFVSHDLIWNLVPADKSFNSSKSNRLPQMDKYFDRYFELQRAAIEIVQRKAPKNKLLEDYLTIFPELGPEYIQRDRLFEQVQPLITIARNNGFEYLR